MELVPGLRRENLDSFIAYLQGPDAPITTVPADDAGGSDEAFVVLKKRNLEEDSGGEEPAEHDSGSKQEQHGEAENSKE